MHSSGRQDSFHLPTAAGNRCETCGCRPVSRKSVLTMMHQGKSSITQDPAGVLSYNRAAELYNVHWHKSCKIVCIRVRAGLLWSQCQRCVDLIAPNTQGMMVALSDLHEGKLTIHSVERAGRTDSKILLALPAEFELLNLSYSFQTSFEGHKVSFPSALKGRF